jgi:hypothetical protein
VRGANGVRDQLCDLLSKEVPRKIPLLQAAWGLPERDLIGADDVVFVSGDAPEQTIKETTVNVVNPRLLNTVRTGDVNALGEPEYHSTYSCRIYVWAISEDWFAAENSRDNLAAACRLSFLQYPTLTQAGGDTGYRVEEGTYTEDYGVPTRANGSRCWAAAILSVDVTVEEFIDAGSTRPGLGIANVVTPQTTAVGPQQPLPGE